MSLLHTYTHDFLYQLLHAAVPFARISDISRLSVSQVMMFLPLRYPQCSHTSWKIYGFYLELFFVQIAKYLEGTFNGKSEPCLCGGKAAINTVFVELPQELTKEISSFMNFLENVLQYQQGFVFQFCEVGASNHTQEDKTYPDLATCEKKKP